MTPDKAISDKVSDQLLSICQRNSAHAAIPLLLAMVLTYVVLNGKVDSNWLKIWLAASCSAIVVRVLLIRAVHRSSQLEGASKRLCATLLTLMLGCSIASVLVFFPDVGLFERAMLTAILLGLCTVSYSTNFGYLPLLLSYITPIMGTLSLMWILNTHQLVNMALAVAVGTSVIIVALTLMRNGKFMFQMFALAIESSTKLEEQSRHLTEALDNAEKAKKEAETSSESKTRFIAAASHDLRQPVHVLNLFSGALKQADIDEPTRDIVDSMNVAVNSLSSQLNSLLDMSELDSGSVQPSICSVDLQHMCARLMDELNKLAENKGIRLENNVQQALYVKTDPKMLSQIIRNLCGNAIKYTHEGSVSLSAECTEQQVTLHIADTGIGIESEECKKVFEEFYQVSNPSRDRAQGLGLGLSIVERLIRALGHDISMESQLGVGTSVHISMPRCQEALADNDDPHRQFSQTAALPDGFWVHVVDDDPTVLQSVRALLFPLGCRVTGSESANEALTFLESNKPSALLVDLRMQGEDSGLRVIDELDRRQSSIPKAMITGESMADARLLVNYPDLITLQKPVPDDELLGLLEHMVDEIQESETDEIQSRELNESTSS
ncbi:MAG: response regulator [Granulosicoccus sp.]|nr:response regulator [Granulosicoccus sp.]